MLSSSCNQITVGRPYVTAARDRHALCYAQTSPWASNGIHQRFSLVAESIAKVANKDDLPDPSYTKGPFWKGPFSVRLNEHITSRSWTFPALICSTFEKRYPGYPPLRDIPYRM